MHRGLPVGEIGGHAKKGQLQVLDMRVPEFRAQQVVHPAPGNE
jgi:hypothetical protein